MRAAKGLVAALKGIGKVSPGVNCKKSFVVINVVPQVALKVLDSSHSYHDKSIFFRKSHYFCRAYYHDNKVIKGQETQRLACKTIDSQGSCLLANAIIPV